MSHTPIPDPLVQLLRRYAEAEYTLIRVEVSPDGLSVQYLVDGHHRYVHHDRDGSVTSVVTGRQG